MTQLFPESLKGKIADITAFVHLSRSRISEYEFEEVGFGGSADIFRGIYRKLDGSEVQVAIKCIRADNNSEEKDKLEKKLIRELTAWDSLRGCDNIIELMGTITGIGMLASPVCEWCPWNLQDYLERKRPPPKHMKMVGISHSRELRLYPYGTMYAKMLETLQGLDYMHNLASGPIAHGDIKLSNILVTASEKAMICDFGRSGKPQDSPVDVSNSSPFVGTVRYMSPELFARNITRPTPAADMWAYGCIALEILCRVPPYHEVSGEYEITRLIQTGHPPSTRPRGARASLLNDMLWDALSSCWKAPDWRPTSHTFLNQLTQMRERGEIPPSPPLLDLFSTMDSIPAAISPWPEELVDLKEVLIIEWGMGKLASSVRSSVWLGFYSRESSYRDLPPGVVIKVPRLNAGRADSTRHEHLQNILRKMVSNRYGVRHRNIIDLIGIDSTFTPHPGFVLESCSKGSLVAYCKDNLIIRHELTRPPAPEANAYSLMCDILEGLQYMHSYPIPIPQGDLTPENILVDSNGVAKISLFSIGRALVALPPTEAVTASIGTLLPLRWMSPELLSVNRQPTTESDMWAVGCVCYWILTELRPYATHRRDDFAGVESVRGYPPGTLENVDIYNSDWITNGIWGAVGRCWRYDPLLRPSSKEFLRMLQELEGRKLRWLPLTVVDLAGKVRSISTGEAEDTARIAQYTTVWIREFNYVKERREEDVHVSMSLYETTYTPRWYSKSAPVAIKLSSIKSQKQPSNTTLRNEITIMNQLDHPHIYKLLGIDSSVSPRPTIVLEFCGRLFSRPDDWSSHERIQILKDTVEAIAYLHGHPNGPIAHGNIQPANIFVLSSGRAKLTNFSCAFQYIVTDPNNHISLSAMAGAPQLPSLYCSPEQHTESGKDRIFLPTLAADIWSFGSTALSVRGLTN
ncbi:MAP3K epsilon protein kinase 1 [Rhizoctonia solani]|uniref:MAP3K epsilon protein kinase 1 n=1 Tax=Rhizoctonia solani TaxID=456999 RepID=A0A0K6GI35_9AGAM|nr:MAP3K epsilon protein kinase 1 [Rhizoctonia solani]